MNQFDIAILKGIGLSVALMFLIFLLAPWVIKFFVWYYAFIV